jgi:hypothetical protein
VARFHCFVASNLAGPAVAPTEKRDAFPPPHGLPQGQASCIKCSTSGPCIAAKTAAWLFDKYIAYAKAHRHPELTEQTIWEVFEAERPKLVPYAGRFDGFHEQKEALDGSWGWGIN